MTISATKFAAASGEDPKRGRILEGALKVFLAYGFARTTMDDIARASDLSRPMLYLQFRNKADIFRAISANIVARSLSEARVGVTTEGAFGARLMNALDRALFGLMDKLDKSAHGEEILDVENKIAADIIADWRLGLTEVVESLVAEEAARTGADLAAHGLTPRALAEILLDGLEGMRHRGLCGKPAIESARQLVVTIEMALTAAANPR